MPRTHAHLSRLTVILLAATALAAPTSAHAATACGNILANTTWTSSITLTCDVYVYPGVTLTVAPGTAVTAASNVSLRVRGVLSAIGTSGSPITFSSTSPPTHWSGIAFETNSGGMGTIQFASVRYADAGTSVQCCWGADPPATILDATYANNTTAVSGYAGSKIQIRRSTFSNNSYGLDSADKQVYDSTFSGNGCGVCNVERTNVYASTFTGNTIGVSASGGSSVVNSTFTGNVTGVSSYNYGPEMHRNTITGNTTGILMGTYGYAPAVTYNNIYGNSSANVRMQGSQNQPMPNNWWGTTNTASIDAGIYDGLDQAGLGLVTFAPVATVAVTQDLTPPNTTFTSTPADPTASSTASFGFTATEASTFECSSDYAPFTSCVSPKYLSGLSDGLHTFRVRATDTDMNTDASPASFSWTVDTIAPETTIVSGPSGTNAAAPTAFQFVSSESGATFVCALDGGTAAACTSPRNLGNLGDGRHVFTVASADGAGNIDPSPATRIWTIDARPPVVTILDPAAPGLYVNGTRTSAGTGTPVVIGSMTVRARATDEGSGVVSFSFKIDDVLVAPARVSYDNASQIYSFVMSGVGPGPHALVAHATDGVGLDGYASQTFIGGSA